MRSLQRGAFLRWFAAALCLVLTVVSAQAEQLSPVPATADSLAAALHATALIIDLSSGRTLRATGSAARGLPGSVIKPLLLQYALTHHIVEPGTEVYCRRNLRVASRRLPCTHPADRTLFTSETALAESCNSWFAQMGLRFTTAQMNAAYATYGLPHIPFHDLTANQRELLALGLDGPLLTPMELGHAYMNLFAQLPRKGSVENGLRGSVRYGMAHPAAVATLDVLGKTGTASNPGEVRTHGWFAGEVPSRWLIAIYVPHGDGGDAARLAQLFFRQLAAGGHLR